MNLADLSKLPPAMQQACLADQARATAARERVMAQVRDNHLYRIGADPERLPTPPAKSLRKAVPVAKQAIPEEPKVSETHIQQAVVRWWKDNAYEWQLEEEHLMAIPNQGRRSRSNSSRMVAEGLRSGVPDLFLAVPRGDCAGFWCELKTRDGVLSENQRLMLARLTKAGYATVVCRSVIEATSAIRAYLNLPTTTKTCKTTT